ncbi:MAG TPA: polysaccharide lyase 8 family protein, partial [Clostridiales bacterium]|nr:polysaccharide lyase 8 family protein [Clostridiales bacterium]
LRQVLAVIIAVVSAISTFITGNDYNSSAVSQVDFDHIKSVYRHLLVGPPDAEAADPVIMQKAQALASNGLYQQSRLKKDGLIPWLEKEKVETSAQISNTYSKTLDMAMAYACPLASTYKDESLFNDILYVLDTMHTAYYGFDVNHLTAFGNWWDWQIGSPMRLVGILILLEENLSRAQIDKYLYAVNYFVPLPQRTSANLVDSAYIVTAAAALQANGERLYKSREKLKEVFEYVKDGDGFYKDGSYVMHINIAYQGGYGTIMLDALSKVISALDKTYFALEQKYIDVQTDWALNSFMPLMYKGSLPGMVRGRNIVRNTDDISIGYGAVVGILRMAEYARADYLKELKSAIKYYYAENEERYLNSSGIYDYCLFKAINEDENIEAMAAPTIAKAFPKMDRFSKIAPDYSVGISMASKRIAKYEAINDENMKGWYTGDGMLYVQNSPYDFNQGYWHNVNFYKLPGTTVTTGVRNEKNLTLNILPNTDFVGSLAFEDYGVAAMQLLGVNGDFHTDLKAKKSWFIFDDEIVALGADINCSDSYDSLTIVENRRLAADKVFYADGRGIEANVGSLSNPKSLTFPGYGGIYFPTDTVLNFERVKNQEDFLELWINHGQKVKEGSYAYVILPNKGRESTLSYAGNPDIEILANSPKVQAVRENNLNISAYVFYSKGNFGNISVNKPCIVIVKEDAQGIRLSVCDPTQKANEIRISLSGGSYEGKNLPCNVSLVKLGSCTNLHFRTADKSGLATLVELEK